jgi:hypothetical protein
LVSADDTKRAGRLQQIPCAGTWESAIGIRLQLRAEFFNVLNHANFALPNPNAFVQAVNRGGAPNPTFGKVTATTTSSRQIQFAVKVLF